MLTSVFVLGCTIAGAYASNQFLAKSLGSNMVLQRDNGDVFLYGYSEKPLNKISVDFNGATYVGRSALKASSDGGHYWKVGIPSLAGGFTKYTLKVTSASGENAVLENVVFGEVYLCSGQSNMQMGVPELEYAAAEIADAENYPEVRLMSLYQDQCAPQPTEPMDDVPTVLVNWSEGSSEAVNHSWGTSALCWEYGKYLFNDILKGSVPVGLVMSSWGGTGVQSWSPQSVTDKCVTTDAQREQLKAASIAAAKKNLDEPRSTPVHKEECAFDPYQNAALYNTMIAPFKEMAFKGALWYQGEYDVGHPDLYYCLQDAMVSAWRDIFGNIPFMYTQLSTWNNGGVVYLPEFRLMQESLLDVTANVAMITAADLGDPYSTSGDIHPRNKTELGRRMTLAASTLIYGTSVPHLGPRIQNATVVTDSVSGYKVRLSFDSFSSAGLNLQPAQVCPDTSAAQGVGGCSGARFIFASGASVDATAVISGTDSIEFVPTVSVSDVPKTLSYGQADYPLMTVYNGVGAPLLPFVRDVSL